MYQKIMLSFYGLIIAMAVFSTHAGAVALGKIDVASHLGEPFYAEVPLTLDEGEVISSVVVELAKPADYRILEVYRDRALQMVRAEVANDSRGSRVEISSRNIIDAPFFNLVLKVRYGRATHFKKYPVFLDLPRAAAPDKGSVPLPSVSVEEAAREAAAPTVTAVETTSAEVSEPAAADEQPAPFTPHDQWARTSHYGPMVYGDTISTVADRLRVDGRYSRNQVMVALFEKNRSKFEKDNINLIQAGTHLDVPMADEVERISTDQARSIMKDHNQRWRELVKQPRYAAVKEAQETRYSKRVRVGKSATGVAAAPVSTPEDGKAETVSGESATPAAASGEDAGGVAESMVAESEVTAALTESVARLQKENEELQAKLAESDANLAKLSAGSVAEAQAAAEARIKKLELQLARLHAELDSARQSEAASSAFGWVTYLLGGLVVVLLGGVGFLMRRERQHPAARAAGEAAYPVDFEDASDVTGAELPEIDVEPVKKPSNDAADQMGVDEFEDAFTDSIPDLTEDETGEMEAFKEDMEEEPDANVDYLSEADVYMRYGMEDEAEKQVQMAIKLRNNNEDAHAKLVQVRKAKGDDAGVDEALSSARKVLSGDSLATFEATISGMAGDIAGLDIEETNLDDTLPPGALDVSDIESETSFDEIAGDQDEIGQPDAVGLEEAVVGGESAEAEEEASLDLGDIAWPEEASEEGAEAGEQAIEEPAEEAPSAEDVTEAVEEDGLDFDLSGLELPDEDASEPEAEVVEEEPETEAEAADRELESESAASVDDDDGLNLSDFDLSDEMIEMSEESEEGTLQVDALDELGTADLDKTVVMDWSKETLASGGQTLGSESGADEIDFSDDEVAVEETVAVEPVAEEPVAEEPVAEEPVAEEPEKNLSSLELDLEDLNLDVDVDLDESMDSGELDDFSSTIQTSLEKIQQGADAGSGDDADAKKVDTIDLEVDEADVDDSFEFDFEPVEEEEKGLSDGEISAEGLGDVSLDDLSGSGSLEDLLEHSDKNYDATMELDSLLSDLDEADEPAEDKKKDSDKES
ncbi:MAG: FimV/HubP family polar landmark protein [Mariprofundaceae bacterium]|nr:FimV/HubP family polar landmark protein [Mariprofundaceae bacterium]